MPDPDPWCPAGKHFTNSAYHKGCRCDVARAAAAKSHNQWKLKVAAGGPLLVPILGTRRRLQALAVEGWPFPTLATMLSAGCSEMVGRWTREGDSIIRPSAGEITDLYYQLESTPGPSRRAAMRAAKKGWPGPERWFELDMDDPEVRPHRCISDSAEVDEVVVARLIAGDRPGRAVNRHERREATRLLWVVGLTTSEIAVRLHEDDRVVSRDVAWLHARGLAGSRGHAPLRVGWNE